MAQGRQACVSASNARNDSVSETNTLSPAGTGEVERGRRARAGRGSEARAEPGCAVAVWRFRKK